MTDEEVVSASPGILVLGIDAGGAASLPAKYLERIATAELLVGGRRHLDYFPAFDGDRLVIGADVEIVAQRLQQALDSDERAIVLASGDPLCYGIGATLRRYFPAEALEIVPAATAFQLAFASLAEPWSDAALLSAHARPLDEVVSRILATTKAAVLTDNRQTPAVVARALLAAGLSPDSACAICENLGSAGQRTVRTRLDRVDQEDYAALNVFVVWNDESGAGSTAVGTGESSLKTDSELKPQAPGLPDESFATSAGQITKREVRLLGLAELALGPGEVMWDIGAGSGSMTIEAARFRPTATIFAVEKRAEFCTHIRENLRRFPAPNVQLAHGPAPEASTGWPDPDAVFVGGSGGRLGAIIEMARDRLRAGGRLVINLATVDNLMIVKKLLPEAEIIQVQISRGAPILDMLRFEALNPVYIVSWRK